MNKPKTEKGGSVMKLAAFCPDKDCDGNCNYQSHSTPLNPRDQAVLESWSEFHKELYLPGSAICTNTIAEWWLQKLQEERTAAYKEGLTENIEALERISAKYKTLFACIRQDVVNDLEAEAVPAHQCSNIMVIPKSALEKYK